MELIKDKDVLTAANRIYAAINRIYFNNTLLEAVIEIEDCNSQYVGYDTLDFGSVLQRLEEIRATGEAQTPLQHKIVITRALITEDKFETLYRLTDVILHEAIHVDTPNDFEHGEEFMTSARQHGLIVETDDSGKYITTSITMEALGKILVASGYAIKK